MENNYTEIFNIKEMLEKENIDFQFSDYSVNSKICYEIKISTEKKCVIVLQGTYSYGGNQNLLQAKVIDAEKNIDEDFAFVNSKEVFEIIKNHL